MSGSSSPVLDALVDEIGSRLGIRSKDLAATGIAGPYMHGPGGLFNVPGLNADIISTRLEPRGLASRLPAVGSIYDRPLFGYITGFLDSVGANATNICDNPPTAGQIKNCIQRAQFGRYSYQTRALEVNRVGLLENRADPMDLRLVNDPLLSALGPTTPGSSLTGGSRSFLLGQEALVRWVEMGVQFQDTLVRQVYTGNPDNNTAGGGYQEFPGLDILISEDKVDAITGTPCPSLRSDIKNFNYGTVSDAGGNTIVNVFSNMFRVLRHTAERTNMGEVKWVVVMRPTLFWELTAVWPCAYMTYRCEVQNNTQTQLVVNSNDQVRMRDEMRNGNYLMIDGMRVEVILDDGIVEENRNDNANIGITCYASDIYFLPLTVRGGMPVTYWEYLDYSRTALPAITEGRYDTDYWTDGGIFLWHKKPPNNWCVQWLAKTEPRIILLTPHLAGRILNVEYCPLQHERDSIIGDDYFVDGGVTSRSATPLYSDWDNETPSRN